MTFALLGKENGDGEEEDAMLLMGEKA